MRAKIRFFFDVAYECKVQFPPLLSEQRSLTLNGSRYVNTAGPINSLSGNETHCHSRAGFRCDLRTQMLLWKKPRGHTMSISNWEQKFVLSRAVSPLLKLRTTYSPLEFLDQQNRKKIKKLGEGSYIKFSTFNLAEWETLKKNLLVMISIILL